MLRSTISHCKQFITGNNRSLSAKLTAQKPRTMQQERSTFSMAGNNQAKKDWNPNLYGKFSGERAKPFLDLLSQIDFKPGMKILDVGCGSGNLTKILTEVPNSTVLGVDNSASMLEAAEKEIDDTNRGRLKFQLGTIEDVDKIEGQFDVLVSNAAIHWVAGHEIIVPKMLSKVTPETGYIAVQVPTNHNQEIYVMMREIAAEPEFDEHLKGFRLRWPVLEIDEYAKLLYANNCHNINCYERVYPHVLENGKAIVDWVSATGMRSYTTRLPAELQEKFGQRLLEKINTKYQVGPIFFPFRRLFFIAQRGKQ
jgi:trans-aconitate 2-methyltransferase